MMVSPIAIDTLYNTRTARSGTSPRTTSLSSLDWHMLKNDNCVQADGEDLPAEMG